MTANLQLTSEAHFDRGSWLVGLCAAAFLAISVSLMLIGNRFPTDGWKYSDNGTEGGPIAAYNIAGEASPLRAGDEVIAVGAQPLHAVGLRPAAAFGGWRNGATVRYRVLRNGQVLDLDVPLRARPAYYWWQYVSAEPNRANSLATLVPLLLALYVFVRRPRNEGGTFSPSGVQHVGGPG